MDEKKLSVLHAIDNLSNIKRNIYERSVPELETILLKLESTMERHRKKMGGVVGTVSLFLNASYYKRLQEQWDHLLRIRCSLYEKLYDLNNWNGPYRIPNSGRKYSCLGWCSSDPLEFIVWRRHLTGTEKPVRPLLSQNSEREWAKYAWQKETLCIDCIVSHNLYCVVCGEVIGSSEEKEEYDGYCICGSCIADRQGQYALASEFVGQCHCCGKQHVLLKLFDRKLLCDSCYKVE